MPESTRRVRPRGEAHVDVLSSLPTSETYAPAAFGWRGPIGCK